MRYASPVWIGLVAGLSLTWSCREGDKDKPAPPKPSSAAPKAKAEKVGRDAVARLKKELKKHLVKAMQSGGPQAAVSVCSRKAQRLTADVVAGLPKGVTIRRTSLRVRNPKNAPTAAERKVLQAFARTHGKPNAPRHHLERDGGASGAYHYYEPIAVQGVCVLCHGPRARIAPPVKALLTKHYPKDAAVGYKPGDLRGAFHVVIPASAVR